MEASAVDVLSLRVMRCCSTRRGAWFMCRLSLLHVMMQRHRETWYLMGTLRQRRPFGGVGILARGGAVGIVPSSESDDLKGRESRSICAT